jgi:hypothetical protein
MNLSVQSDEPLCRTLADADHQLWNSDWLPVAYSGLLSADNFIDQAAIQELETVIEADEVQLFDY